MSKAANRNTVYCVNYTAVFKGEAGKEDWDTTDSVKVLACDAEEAISRIKTHLKSAWLKDEETKHLRKMFVNHVSEVTMIDVM